jgi:signal transduction histidine kinase
VDRFAIGIGGREPRIFSLALAELHGPTGGWVVTMDEVSEQVRMEQQLVQSERLAAVGLLASGVAHEINTPLTGIGSYAQMLLDERPDGDPDREMLERIRKESWRASHIANSLLNFSRGGEDGFQELDLNRTVEETLSLFGPQLKGRRIEVQFEPAAVPARVRGHQGRLQQVLLNLLLNARDAMPAGGAIRIRTEVDNGRVALRVADTGEGIAAEHLDRIYDPFFTTKRPGRGTGLGLSVSYGIVRDHKGSLDVRSRPGEGTEFAVVLPALAASPVRA